MISQNEPVTGQDLDVLRISLNLQHFAFCYIMGISQNRWNLLRRQKVMRQPVKDPSIAILSRWLFAHQEDCPQVARTTPFEFFKLITEDHGINVSERAFGVMLGRHPTALFRWRTAETISSVPPSVRHCILALENGMKRMGPRKAVLEWLEVVQVEARARGIQDILNLGMWSKEQTDAIIEAKANSRPPGRPRGSKNMKKVEAEGDEKMSAKKPSRKK